MTEKQVLDLLARLEAVFGAEYNDKSKKVAPWLLQEYDPELSSAVIVHLTKSARRMPSIADIAQAFESVVNSDRPSRDAARSAPESEETRSRNYQALLREKEMEVVYHHPDLYGRYVQALAELKSGYMSREEFERLRALLIEQASMRGIPKGQPVELPSGHIVTDD